MVVLIWISVGIVVLVGVQAFSILCEGFLWVGSTNSILSALV